MVNSIYEQPKANQNLKLAQAYVLYQQYQNLFPIDEALYRGTIFQDLYTPYKPSQQLRRS